jgi:hypothetical protein
MRGFCKCRVTFKKDIHTYVGNQIYEYRIYGSMYTVETPSLLNPDLSVGYQFSQKAFDEQFDEFTQQQIREMRLDTVLKDNE